MKEIWKHVAGYEGLYEISNLARVKAKEYSWVSGKGVGVKKSVPERILNQRGDRYFIVTLLKDGIRKTALVHRLVALAFIPNDNNLPQINHINGCKKDNRIENLEWCTSSENCLHAHRTGLAKPNYYCKESHSGSSNGNSKPVYQYDLRGAFIKDWECVKYASDFLKVDYKSISSCACGDQKSAFGFQWSYKKLDSLKDVLSESHGLTKKAVNQYTTDGIFVNSFNSVSEAALKNGFLISAVSNCLRGYTKTSNGYVWSYAN